MALVLRNYSASIGLRGILCRSWRRRPLESEKDLESYQRFAIEEKVVDIVSQLLNDPDARQLFTLGNSIKFENHANTLSGNAEDTTSQPPSIHLPSLP